MSTPTIPNHGAAALGGPIETTFDPSLFFSPPAPAEPTFTSPRTTPPPLNTTTTLTPGANGAAPTLGTTSSGSFSDPTTGIVTNVSGSGQPPNFAPNNVELTLPLVRDGGLKVDGLVGARSAGFVTGVGASVTEGDITFSGSYRLLTPPDLQSQGTHLYGAGVTVGKPDGVRFSATATLQDAPGVARDQTGLNAALTAPLGNGWTGSINGGVTLRPGADNDTVGGGLRFANPDFNAELRVNQTGGETVGTVRLGVSF
jgi:hypothetical protein